MKTCNIALGFLSLLQNPILAATRPIPDIESDIDTKRLRGSTKNPTRSNENVALRNRAGTRMLEGDNYEDGINYKEVGNYYASDGTYEDIENEYYDQSKNGDNYTVDGNEENYDYYYHNETEYYNDYEEIYYDEMLKNNTDYPKEEEKQEILFSDGNFDINTPLQAHGSFDELEEQEEIDEEIVSFLKISAYRYKYICARDLFHLCISWQLFLCLFNSSYDPDTLNTAIARINIQ